MQDRRRHQGQVRAFLQAHFPDRSWELTLPEGSGNETYFARSPGQATFVKLGVQAVRYEAIAAIGVTPPVLAAGSLEDGTSIIVQAYIAGRTPTRKDYREQLEQFAAIIDKVHHSPALKQVLPQASSDLYSAAGWGALIRLQQKWELYRPLVPQVAGFIDESLDDLVEQVKGFQGTGLVASHNDICNANWLLSEDKSLYLIDLELSSLDDPAVDIGATLWWYYPPELRPRFLASVGYAHDEAFEKRMRVRMAMHCLNIILPRAGSFDWFDAASFAASLADFRASLAGEENPQGYEDSAYLQRQEREDKYGSL